ncbi:WD40 repeat-like protein [Calocera viscosa TUFC12733]|uniref:WD40 repeat-like protein n=1 Tax=Calocera viscosa (strain TUFC12733) TaxID=1330018 RepID=A0A167L7B8_CALVF|nr:WD40 repeat-like protein [Calocera viscosa TUFC12733]
MDEFLKYGSPGGSDESDEMEEQDDDIEQLPDEENEEQADMDAEDDDDDEDDDEDDDDDDDDEDEDAEAEDEDEKDALNLAKSLEEPVEGEDEDEDAEGDDDYDEDESDADMEDAEGEDEDKDYTPKAPQEPTSAEQQRRSLFFTADVPHRSYGIDPICALPHPEKTHTNCLAGSLCLTHLMTGSDDGFVRDYDFFAGVNGESLLTSQQRQYCGLGEGITKGGVMRSWWMNSSSDGAEKQALPVHSLICQMDALWGLSGTSNGHVNLFSIRHDPGNIHHVFKGHVNSPVSCLAMAHDEKSFYSGGWDHQTFQWDLNTGQIIRPFQRRRQEEGRQQGSQMTVVALRPEGASLVSSPGSSPMEEQGLPAGVPQQNGGIAALTPAEEPPKDGTEPIPQVNGTTTTTNGLFTNPQAGVPPPPGLPDANAEDNEFDPLFDAEMDDNSDADADAEPDPDHQPGTQAPAAPPQPAQPQPMVNGMVNGRGNAMVNGHGRGQGDDSSDDDATDLPTTARFFTNIQPQAATQSTASTVPLLGSATYTNFSDNVLMTASVDGQVLLWDTRVQGSVGRLEMHERTPKWCISACWSPDGRYIYAGRRNQSVDMWDLRVLGQRSATGAPRVLRTIRNPDDSGPVSCVAAFPDGDHIVTASKDNIRLWNVRTAFEAEANPLSRRAGVQFKIIAGHHDGIISSILIDATSKFMITASGDRGFNLGDSSRTVLVHEVSPLR